MAKCKDCLHYEACSNFSKIINSAVDVETGCEHFKNRIDVTEVVRCKNCINGIYDEENNIYKCVKSADYDPEYDDWLGFVSYHNADYYCADGERRTDEN